MKINASIIKSFNPCNDRYDNFVNNYGTIEYDLKSFLEMDKINYTDKVWVVTRLFTHEQNVKWSIACASSVLDIYEKLYPDDKRPREAIEAAVTFVLNPCAETRFDFAFFASQSVVWAARSAAKSVVWAAKQKQEQLNLLFIMEVYNET